MGCLVVQARAPDDRQLAYQDLLVLERDVGELEVLALLVPWDHV